MTNIELEELINTIQPNTVPSADNLRNILLELLKRLQQLENK